MPMKQVRDMGSSPSPPPVYNNPSTVIPQAEQANIQTAQQQANINNVSQYNPLGSSVYTEQPNGSYTLNQSLSPEMQNIFGGATGAAGSLANQTQQAYANPQNINPSSAINQAMGMQQQYLAPYFQQQQNVLNSNLEAQGIAPGDQAWNMAQMQNTQAQTGAMQSALAQFEPLAYGQAVQSYELPAQTLGALEGTIPGAPSTVNTPQTGVPATDVAGIYNEYQQALNQQYQAQVQQTAATNGGLFGLGSAGILGASMFLRPPGTQVA